MPDEKPVPSPASSAVPAMSPLPHQLYITHPARRWAWRLLGALLIASIIANLYMYASFREYFAVNDSPSEQYHSGARYDVNKIALVEIKGVISPPFTSRVIRSIKKARDDSAVKGAVLGLDSPGGLVTDRHEIYHELTKLRQTKPIVVSMGSIAASGGYYAAMGAGTEGKIFAEPTTWTGSIGVIIPRYEVVGLAEKLGFESKPLKTGPYKDALSPFRALTPDEQQVWDRILDQSYQRFLKVIDDNRPKLNYEQVKALATGAIYTADDALANGLVDVIGYKEDAIAELKKQVQLEQARVVDYHFSEGWMDLLASSMRAQDPAAPLRTLLEATVPKAMYLCSWGLAAPQ